MRVFEDARLKYRPVHRILRQGVVRSRKASLTIDRPSSNFAAWPPPLQTLEKQEELNSDSSTGWERVRHPQLLPMQAAMNPVQKRILAIQQISVGLYSLR